MPTRRPVDMAGRRTYTQGVFMRPFQKWLYVQAFNLVARLAPADVRAVHIEVLNRGFQAYEDARKVEVLLREDIR